MASQVDIYNMALGNIGSSEQVGSLTERSKAQLTCTQYYATARDAVLSDFPWPFATRYATLAPLANQSLSYDFTYQYPIDCLRANFIVAAGLLVQPDEKYQPRFEVSYGDNGQVILTNEAGATLSYIVRVEDTVRFPATFVEALAWKLASLIAMPMVATRTVAETASAMYQGAIQIAQAHAANQSKFDHNHESEYVTERGL